MKIELHLHTSRYSPCAVNTPWEMIAALIAHGYDAVFITEHVAVWPDRELDELRGRFGRIRIHPGIELALGKEGAEHVLVLGSNDPEYLRLAHAREVLDRARRHEHLVILAHPFRWPHGDDMLREGLLPDALEHLTGNQQGEPAERSAVEARRLGLRAVNAGDTHALEMLNRFWIETDAPVDSPADVRRAVLAGAYRNCAG